MNELENPSVLNGYTVLDCSIAMAGPFATQRLGDLGADVIKIEPTTGEWQRHAPAGGAAGSEINVSFLSLNRNKRSLALDLKAKEGRDLLYEIVKKADVFLQNYRPGVAERLGVDYETLKQLNPALVYVSISGFGESGPYKDRPGQDLLVQALSGAMLSAGARGAEPQAAGQYVVDAITASTAFEGALAGLLHKERTGEGQHITVNMLDAITAIQMQELSVFTVGGIPQKRSAQPHAHAYIRAPYGTFKTSDGYMVLSMPHLPTLGQLIGEPSFDGMDENVEGWTHRDEIFEKTAAKLGQNTTEHWLKVLGDGGLWVAPIYGYADLVNDPQIVHNGTFVEYDHHTEGRVKTPGFPYRFSKTPPQVYRGAPRIGEHSRSVLESLGVDAERLDELIRSGVVAQHGENN